MRSTSTLLVFLTMVCGSTSRAAAQGSPATATAASTSPAPAATAPSPAAPEPASPLPSPENPRKRARDLYLAAAADYRSANYGAALEKLAQALDLHDSPTILLARGMVYERMGQKLAAAQSYTGYLRRVVGAPDSEALKRRIAWLEGSDQETTSATREPNPSSLSSSDVGHDPVSPEPPPTPHVHDGFYLRMNVLTGFARTGKSDIDSPPEDTPPEGFTLGGELLLGGSPIPGLVIGAGLPVVSLWLLTAGRERYMHDGVVRSGVSSNEYGSPEGTAFLSLLVDIYPDPGSGWHIQILPGAGVPLGPAPANKLMIGGAVGFGYDAWIGSQWSFGVGPRLGVFLAPEDGTSYLWPALSAGFLYH